MQKTSRNTQISTKAHAQRAGRESDPELYEVAEAWVGLPDAVKAGIMAMVRVSPPTQSATND